MYFIVCDHCGRENHVKTEFQTFCEHCGKKISNNYQEWKKVHAPKTFQDFKDEVCMRKDDPVIVNSTKKPRDAKRKRDIIVLIASIVVMAILGAVFGTELANATMNYFGRNYAVSGVFRPADPASWKTLTAESGDFEIKFPGTPVKSSQNSTSGIGEIIVTMYNLEPKVGNDDNLNYIIAFSQYPPYTVDSRYMTGIEIDQVLEQSIQGSVSGVKGTLISQANKDYEGYKGKDFIIEVQHASAYLHGRCYLVNNTVYTMNVIEPAKNKSNASTAMFLDSFHLLK